jgi:hypothetical protein
MAYVWADRWGDLLTAALTFFGGSAAAGITVGIRLELLVLLASFVSFSSGGSARIGVQRQSGTVAYLPAAFGVAGAAILDLPVWDYDRLA